MHKPLVMAAAATFIVLSWPAQAADKTIVLAIRNADCVLCPPIVRRSLLRVQGVKDVKISQANQAADFLATITYDDAVTNDTALVAVTTKAGYPSHIASTN